MHRVIVQHTVPKNCRPLLSHLKTWAKAVLALQTEHWEVTLRIVDSEEMRALNSRYRQKPGPTNVLSFPYDEEDCDFDKPGRRYLGDIVICAEVVNQEALDQHKSREAHWAHMVIHGVLHLLGYDHIEESDAHQMEETEMNILKHLGFPNPY
jgi:probable rRNA maturation factor